MPNNSVDDGFPGGVSSLLDTDLYKLTMQCAILKYFPDVELGNLRLAPDELDYLQSSCAYLNQPYLDFLKAFRFQPSTQIKLRFDIDIDNGTDADVGDLHIEVEGLWVETILYEIPLLALVSEAFFRFCDRDWTYEGQDDRAYHKGTSLLQHGCVFSEFGTRRRRDYRTQELVIQGLVRASQDKRQQGSGKLAGTSNVHFAMKYGLEPVGTVAHEWFMGIAAITDDYENVSEVALRYWIGCFGRGVLGIALTDTFGTVAFLRAFRRPVPAYTAAVAGRAASMASTAASLTSVPGNLAETKAPLHSPIEENRAQEGSRQPTYAEAFAGVRQDSGDPEQFILLMRDFYDSEGVTETKTIVFSDSLNIDLCVKYKQDAEKHGFHATFGVGTFLTNDFLHASTGTKSSPLNIVIKLSSAGGRPAVKISDNIGKNTGDPEVVEKVKQRLGYVERTWKDGDETARWESQETIKARDEV
ncbi:MAG: nicotinate phosphoribosyltransferase [Phylliscum demangeonii]|nr:MAG: nicotinate phosphoribosyltransferase [Phylliscum demangeonii]